MSRWRYDENPFDQSIGVEFDRGNKGQLHGWISLNNERHSFASTTQIFDSKTGLFNDGRFEFPPGSSLHGVSEKGNVSLILCHRGSATFATTTSCTVHSQYAVFGNDHLHRHDPVIRAVHFEFEDIRTIFDLNRGVTVGIIHDADHRIAESIGKHKPEYAPDPRRYDRPLVIYCDGKCNLLPTTQTVLGSVDARRTRYTTTSRGVAVDDYPRIAIEFADDPVTLERAVDKMSRVRQFFAWMIGYAPVYRNVSVFIGDKPSKGEYDPNELDVFLSHKGGTTGGEHIMGGSILVSPSYRGEYFMDVMTKWLERDDNGHVANLTFFGMMRGMFAPLMENKMCMAANVFDQLPSRDKPSERARMLDIARHRYQRIVRPHLAVDLDRMNDVIETAINCRHYLTHGSTDRERHGANYSDYRSMMFFTEALRFVYGASELIECGWNMKEWLGYHFKRNHPFGAFIDTYDAQLAAALPS